MSSMRPVSQSLTAYKCRICERNRSENLLKRNEDNPEPIDLVELLKDYFKYIKKSKIDKYTNRTILLQADPEENYIDDKRIKRLIVHPKAGKANEDFNVVEHETNKITSFKGDKNSAIYDHNVFCYVSDEDNVLVFHRHGQSGCKTAFINTFNEFLRGKNLICHLDVMVSSCMLEGKTNYVPEKLNLITTYSDVSSDIADNINESKKRKKVEQEVIISLASPKAHSIVVFLQSLHNKKFDEKELKNILIKNDFVGEFDDAKVTLKFGNVRRKINLTEFSGLIAEYDITYELEYIGHNIVKQESLYALADEYALSFFDKKEETK